MFDAWSNFFTMTGSAGATLVGLLFIAVTLNTDCRRPGRWTSHAHR